MDTTTPKPFGQGVSGAVNQVADTASSAIRATQGATNGAFDRMSDTVEGVREQAAPMISKLASQAETVARRGADAVRETSAQLRERAHQASDATVGYIKEEPLKAMLIAAATGAALMALLNLMSRARANGG